MDDIDLPSIQSPQPGEHGGGSGVMCAAGSGTRTRRLRGGRAVRYDERGGLSTTDEVRAAPLDPKSSSAVVDLT